MKQMRFNMNYIKRKSKRFGPASELMKYMKGYMTEIPNNYTFFDIRDLIKNSTKNVHYVSIVTGKQVRNVCSFV